MADESLDRLADRADRSLGRLQGYARRAVMHAAVLGMLFFLMSDSPVTTIIGLYLGIMVLLPQKNGENVISLGFALGQGLLLAAFMYPLHAVVFFAGVQAWIQRCIHQRGRLRIESWAFGAVLALAGVWIGLAAVSAHCMPWALLSVPVIAGVGIARQYFVKARTEAEQYKLLVDALRSVQTRLREPSFPESLRPHAEALLTQGTAYAQLRKEGDASDYDFIRRVADMGKRLEGLASAGGTGGRAMKVIPGWSKALFAPPKNPSAEKETAACLAALAKEAEARVQALQPKPKGADAKQEDGEERLFLDYEEKARLLQGKKSVLPPVSADCVEHIAASVFDMVRSMRQDERDRASGHRFLGRYLPAVHRIVDEYARLNNEGAGHKDVAAALSRSEETLKHLQKAFADEYASMLENDAVDYTAELNALDALLKMRGH